MYIYVYLVYMLVQIEGVRNWFARVVGEWLVPRSLGWFVRSECLEIVRGDQRTSPTWVIFLYLGCLNSGYSPAVVLG
mgnify:CR=1 FL=1